MAEISTRIQTLTEDLKSLTAKVAQVKVALLNVEHQQITSIESASIFAVSKHTAAKEVPGASAGAHGEGGQSLPTNSAELPLETETAGKSPGGPRVQTVHTGTDWQTDTPLKTHRNRAPDLEEEWDRTIHFSPPCREKSLRTGLQLPSLKTPPGI